MPQVALLLSRLQQIAEALAKRPSAVALLGLGSVGLERERLDQYSDLDFFVIAAPGKKHQLLSDMSWLSDPAPLAYRFANTADGCKALYADGVFCEFAVFELAELASVTYAPGQVIWHRPAIDPSMLEPKQPLPQPTMSSAEWLVGEALTNLLVGMQRDVRGERLSAMRFVQVYALDRIIELTEQRQANDSSPPADPFSLERRFEMRHQHSNHWLLQMAQGYNRNAQSALAILRHLQNQFDVEPTMAQAIDDLCQQALAND
ncbi:hypothetical protein K0504_15870 [Neiella marina]|uniref:Uncharacterized protein n=1 Tax=Neiella holothuriorum TaxID=2870530 RepID=A0ABS7ELG0_9GAMM|nr:hypothetical protein [Neiella holothuriorum]MBW8192517.1 hypothetical protein [Neiella holothuriorum]